MLGYRLSMIDYQSSMNYEPPHTTPQGGTLPLGGGGAAAPAGPPPRGGTPSLSLQVGFGVGLWVEDSSIMEGATFD